VPGWAERIERKKKKGEKKQAAGKGGKGGLRSGKCCDRSNYSVGRLQGSERWGIGGRGGKGNEKSSALKDDKGSPCVIGGEPRTGGNNRSLRRMKADLASFLRGGPMPIKTDGKNFRGRARTECNRKIEFDGKTRISG